MQKVFKYEIRPKINEILLPKDSTILSTAFQDDDLYIWVLVDPEKSTLIRKFQAFGTGHEIHVKIKNFIGTAHESHGLVFHVFEID